MEMRSDLVKTMEWRWTNSQRVAHLAMFRLMVLLEAEPYFNRETHHGEHGPVDGRIHNFANEDTSATGVTHIDILINLSRGGWLAVTAIVTRVAEHDRKRTVSRYRFQYTRKDEKFQGIILEEDPMAYLKEWELEPCFVD